MGVRTFQLQNPRDERLKEGAPNHNNCRKDYCPWYKSKITHTWYKCSLNTRCVPITWDQILSYTTRDHMLTWHVYDVCLAHSCYTWKIVGVWIGLLLCASKSAWSQRPRCVDVLPQWSIVHLIVFFHLMTPLHCILHVLFAMIERWAVVCVVLCCVFGRVSTSFLLGWQHEKPFLHSDVMKFFLRVLQDTQIL